MAQLDFAIFDADNHYYEAEDAFTRHIDPRLKRRAIEWAVVDGRKTLLVAGKVNRFIPNPTFDPVAKPGCLEQYYRGHNPKNLSMRELFGQLEPIQRAYRDRDERLRVMDAQGIERAFLFPTLGVGMEEALRGDPEALCAAFHAFNAWLAEDWGYAFRERLYGAPLITLVDPAKAVAELEWVLARDARLVCMRAAPVPAPDRSRSLGDPLYDSFWARAQEAGVVIAFHGGDHGYNKYADDWGEGGDFRAFAGTPLRGLISADRAPFDTFAALICHGVFERFPGLRMASVEMGSDWVRELLRKLKRSFGQAPGAYREDPVETFRRHVWVSPFHEEDLRGMADLVGVGRMLMGSDFPHAEGIAVPSDYVHELKGFSPREVRLVMRENALTLAERQPVH
ncbi:MAG TPA: amidohydrolase family protein [Myxococcota bacterium]|nr:amidohydrolase family protein [Myxococcota bacterium]